MSAGAQIIPPPNFDYAETLSEITKFILHLNMKDSFREDPTRNRVETGPKAIFSLMDFRAGHWPGTKTPPWLLNETWEMRNPEWRDKVATMDWTEGNEVLVGSGVIDGYQKKHEVDIYARRDDRRGPEYFGFAVYPKGKKESDFWNKDGTEKDTKEE